MDQYPISVRELIAIALKETGKSVPILGAIIGAHEAVFGAIELNRIKLVMADFGRRLDELEKRTGRGTAWGPKASSVLMYAADQVRGDILAEAKVAEYGSAIVRYAEEDADLNEVAEVLDCLRKLSADDLKVLYSFRLGGKLTGNRSVAELAGYSYYPAPNSIQALRSKMESLYPSLMRLEGLGVIYLAHSHGGGGMLPPDIGGLSEHLRKFAFLTRAGTRLVNALPN